VEGKSTRYLTGMAFLASEKGPGGSARACTRAPEMLRDATFPGERPVSARLSFLSFFFSLISLFLCLARRRNQPARSQKRVRGRVTSRT